VTKPIVGIVHATRNAIAPLNEVMAARLRVDATILNFLDEAMLSLSQTQGAVAPTVVRRMQSIFASAQEAGAVAIVASCTSLAPAVAAAQRQVQVPVIRVDVPLAEEAVSRFKNVAVVVTAETAVEPFRALLKATSDACDKAIQSSYHFCPGAFAALSDGNSALHNRIVLKTITSLATTGIDAILLPQPSTATIARHIPGELAIPVMSGVGAAADRVVALLNRIGWRDLTRT
jgi:Asp/Glu/hydantoin racemase